MDTLLGDLLHENEVVEREAISTELSKRRGHVRVLPEEHYYLENEPSCSLSDHSIPVDIWYEVTEHHVLVED